MEKNDGNDRNCAKTIDFPPVKQAAMAGRFLLPGERCGVARHNDHFQPPWIAMMQPKGVVIQA